MSSWRHLLVLLVLFVLLKRRGVRDPSTVHRDSRTSCPIVEWMSALRRYGGHIRPSSSHGAGHPRGHVPAILLPRLPHLRSSHPISRCHLREPAVRRAASYRALPPPVPGPA